MGLLRSMVALGYMEHSRGLYRLGPKAFRLAADILAIRRFPNLVRPILQEPGRVYRLIALALAAVVVLGLVAFVYQLVEGLSVDA